MQKITPVSVIPIVFAVAGDPVNAGLVASLARPGGNVTGLSAQQRDLVGKRLELLREVVPGLRRLAIMSNADNPGTVLEMGDVLTTARTLGLDVVTLEIRRAEDIAPAFDALKGRADALYVCNDPLVNTNRIKAQNGHAARAVVCNAHDGLDMRQPDYRPVRQQCRCSIVCQRP